MYAQFIVTGQKVVKRGSTYHKNGRSIIAERANDGGIDKQWQANKIPEPQDEADQSRKHVGFGIGMGMLLFISSG